MSHGVPLFGDAESLHLVLRESAVETLDQLQQETGAEDHVDVLRVAISTLEFLCAREREGFTVALIKDGVTVSLEGIIPFRPHRRQR